MPAPRQTRVKVFLRSRPCENFANDMIEYGSDDKTVNIYNRRRSGSQAYVNNQVTDWSFKVDGILHNVSQGETFDSVAKDMSNKALDGYNGTVLCYGQTGAGKTFTMTGATENYEQRGLIPRTIQHLFKEIQNRQDRSYTIRIGYLEIYNEQLFDLLATMPLSTSQASISEYNSGLSIFDDRGDVFVKGLTYQLAATEEDALNLLFEGETNRSIGTHILNKESSRSHCIFTIRIESKSISSSDEKYTLSKMNLVDLAGSERLAKTQSVGITQKEAQYINKSLSFLEQAVIGLSDSKKPFVQFRQCKLTHILKDSIGGNCMTYMIANIWPEARHMEETVSTLRFSSRMMNVTVEPAVNEIIDPMRMMQKLDNEVKMLRQELAMHDTLSNKRAQSYEPLSEHQLYEIENQCRRFIEGSLDEIEIVNFRQIQATYNSFKRICKVMEKDVEAKLREKFALIDKSDVEQLAEAQKAGLTIADDSSYAGESDGQSFGVGIASKDARMSKNELLKVTKGKRSKATGAKTSSPPLDSKSSLKAGSKDLLEQAKKDSNKDNALFQAQPKDQPTTPPPKNVAFEEFKAERGNEINRIWNENKDILTNKRRQYSDLAQRINDTKLNIDNTRNEVERKRAERISMGEFVNEMGEQIIDEEEFGLIKRLQDLKGKYRDDFDKWRELKAEIVYCQNLVEQCRQRLIQEFEMWYNETYLTNGYLNRGFSIPNELKRENTGNKQYEDAVEKFERMQKNSMGNDPDSIPYNTARLRNDRKHVYNDALEKASHHYMSNQTIGTPVRKQINPPPGKLYVN